jgi:hypothetical protein
MEISTKMNDGTEAWLSQSGRYYVRRMPTREDWNEIAYYDIDTKERIQLSKGICNSCGETIESKHCGNFVRCTCGESFVDTDRWMPEHGRYGGDIQPVDNSTR